MAGANTLTALLLLLALAVTAASAGDHMQLGLLSTRGADAADGRDELQIETYDASEGELGSADAEAHRRFLQSGNGYISYGALRRGTVPCNRRGASYYNCRPGAQSNPYRRGCSRITRCRG